MLLGPAIAACLATLVGVVAAALAEAPTDAGLAQHRARMRSDARRARRGLTLMEIMVVLAIMALVLGISVPTVSNMLALQQGAVVEELALTYRFLREEAALRNVTFRIAYNLDRGTYKVEVGDPSTLIFTSPDELKEFEEKRKEELSKYTQRERDEGGAENAEMESEARFMGLTDQTLNTEVELPSDSVYGWVWTPQYGEPVQPTATGEDEEAPDAESEVVVYSYIFPNGFTEHTLVRIVDEDDPESGYTLEVEPLSGKVTVHDTLVTPDDSMSWLPDEGPRLENGS